MIIREQFDCSSNIRSESSFIHFSHSCLYFPKSPYAVMVNIVSEVGFWKYSQNYYYLETRSNKEAIVM